ncbi:hypothetical protein, partial [Amycolatopsis decaplanina]|uniref:hypothetical protein n=1 Tax=Amycolatopsis decaplanina TaxID=208441 RepID=UPI001267D1A9
MRNWFETLLADEGSLWEGAGDVGVDGALDEPVVAPKARAGDPALPEAVGKLRRGRAHPAAVKATWLAVLPLSEDSKNELEELKKEFAAKVKEAVEQKREMPDVRLHIYRRAKRLASKNDADFLRLENALREAAGAASPGLDQQKLTFDREEHGSRAHADLGITVHDSPDRTEQSYRTSPELDLSLAHALQKHVLSAADVRRLRLLVEGLVQALDNNVDPDGELRLEAHLVARGGSAELQRSRVTAEIRAAVQAARPQYSAAQVEEFIARHVVMGVTRTVDRDQVGLFLTLVRLDLEPDPVPDHAVAVAKQAEYGKLPSLPKELSGRVVKRTDVEADSWKANLEAGKPFSIVEDDRKSLNEFMKKILSDIADRARHDRQLGDIRLHVTRMVIGINSEVRLREHEALEELVKRAALEQSIDLSKFRFTYVAHRAKRKGPRSVGIAVHKTPQRGKSDYLGETSLTEFFIPRLAVLPEAARERITWLSTGFIVRYKTGQGGNKVLSIAVAQPRQSGAHLLVKEVRDLVLAAFREQLPGPEGTRQARRILEDFVPTTLYRARPGGVSAVLVDVVEKGEVSSVRREEWEEQARSTRMASRAAREAEGLAHTPVVSGGALALPEAGEFSPDGAWDFLEPEDWVKNWFETLQADEGSLWEGAGDVGVDGALDEPVVSPKARAGDPASPKADGKLRRGRARPAAVKETWLAVLPLSEDSKNELEELKKKFAAKVKEAVEQKREMPDVRLHIYRRANRPAYKNDPDFLRLENALREAAGAASPGLDQQKLTFDHEEHGSRAHADLGITVHDSPNWTEQSYRTRRELDLSLAHALQKHVLSAADVRRLR